MSLSVRTKLFSGTAWTAPLGAVASKRDHSSALGTKGDRLELIRKGTGGRSSFNGVVATVFGSTGFFGTYLVNALGKCGTMMILPYRGDSYAVAPLKVAGDLGQILFQHFHLNDEKSIAKAMQYSNVVINLVGKDTETLNFSHKDVHVDGARRIARLARECGVEKLIHFSALNATEKPKKAVLRPSKFYATKWEGENAVREEFPDAIIFRPSDMYGQSDRFLLYYAGNARRYVNVVPLWKSGKGIYKAPVYVQDVAKAVVKAVFEKGNEGTVYQAVGPKLYELSELVDYMFRVMRRDTEGYLRYDMRLDPLFLLRVMIMEYARPKYPPLSFERLEREHTSDTIEIEHKLLSDLGIKLTEVEEQVPFDLKYWRSHAYYDPDIMQFERVTSAPSVSV